MTSQYLTLSELSEISDSDTLSENIPHNFCITHRSEMGLFELNTANHATR
jgi:hypothetical protein